ncbi:MAG: hypothetical protein DI534_15330 [Leifsonia xyli]|nr:MAG: hypothetical protein DI534_15330 [Leifsonia xyli]
MAKHELFPHGAGPEQVSAAVALAQYNCREEMTGFNAMRKPQRPFASVEEFVRFKLWKASKTAFGKMAPLLDGATVFRVTFTASKEVRSDRRSHANGLKRFMQGALREIGPAVAAHCSNLHVDAQDYLHVDVTVVVRDEDVADFKQRARRAHTLGWRRKLGVRGAWCHISVQGKTKEDLERTLNYTLRFDRFRRRPSWTREAIRAIGVARASGFRRNRRSQFSKTNAGAANLLKRRTNPAGNSGGSNLRQTQVTTKNPNVASPPPKKVGSRPRGRPAKHSHAAYRKGFRRDREAREGVGASLAPAGCGARPEHRPEHLYNAVTGVENLPETSNTRGESQSSDLIQLNRPARRLIAIAMQSGTALGLLTRSGLFGIPQSDTQWHAANRRTRRAQARRSRALDKNFISNPSTEKRYEPILA